MASPNDFTVAMTNRSLRNIRSELDFLADASVITPQQHSSILSQLRDLTMNLPEVSQPRSEKAASSMSPAATPAPTQPPPGPYSPPTSQFANATLNEKSSLHNQFSTPPPPAYQQGPPVLSVASALYAYTPTDAGDLALQPNDRIQVLEHMNNDWWRGRNERTNLEGIFPRSYVRVIEEKSVPPAPVPPAPVPQPTNYGNMPLEVSQSGSGPQAEGKHSRFGEQGKKFGKKLGNAAIFGAGATMGADLVNSIF